VAEKAEEKSARLQPGELSIGPDVEGERHGESSPSRVDDPSQGMRLDREPGCGSSLSVGTSMAAEGRRQVVQARYVYPTGLGEGSLDVGISLVCDR
jgi:hypothetical protein